jgi:hypothetical protein
VALTVFKKMGSRKFAAERTAARGCDAYRSTYIKQLEKLDHETNTKQSLTDSEWPKRNGSAGVSASDEDGKEGAIIS